jgi:hypothetical protein
LKIRPKAHVQFAAATLILAALIGFELLGLGVSTEELLVHGGSGDIHVTAPRLHFLIGKSLQRLHDGAIVPFDFQLSIAAGSKSNVVARAVERFTVSYDVWQEKFSVIRLRDFRKSSLSLSANAAEVWCLDSIFVSAPTLPADRQLWAHLEIRSVEPRDQILPVRDPNISIATLIEIFSRTPRPQQDHWSFESPVFHLADLKP